MTPPPTESGGERPGRGFARAVFILTLAGLIVYGLTNYSALLNADSYSYLSYARDLSRGSFVGEYGFYEIFESRWPEDRPLNLQSGVKHLVDGQIYYGIEAGYPLLLAAVMRVFGFDAAHLLNPCLLLVLAAVYFFAIRLMFRPLPGRDLLAVLSLLLFLLVPPGRVFSSSMKIMRDIAPLTFLMTGFLCLLCFARKKKPNLLFLFFSSVLLGMASLMRLTYSLFLFPFFLYLAVSLFAERVSRRRAAAAVLVAVLGLTVFLLPVLAQNIYLHRDILFTARLVGNYFRSLAGPGHLFNLRYLGMNGTWYLDFIYRSYGPLLLLCALLGAAAAGKKKSVICFLLPVLVIHFFLFAVFRYKHSRYLLPVYAVLAALSSYGLLCLLSWLDSGWKRLARRPGGRYLAWIAAAAAVSSLTARTVLLARSGWTGLGAADVFLLVVILALLGGLKTGAGYLNRPLLLSLSLAGLFALFAGDIIPPVLRNEGFKISDVRRLKLEFEEHTSPGSLVIATRYLKQNIDMYTHCYSLNARQVGGPWKLDLDQALRKVMDAGVEVYIVDNRGFRNNAKYVPFLRDYFQLVPVVRWRSEELRIRQPYFSSGEYLNLYRVLPRPGEDEVLHPEPAGPGVLDGAD